VYTLCEALGRTGGRTGGRADGFDLGGVRVAIVGDVLHSRVARSAVAALTALGASVELVGPEPLVPRSLEALGGDGGGGSGVVTIERDMGAAIERADAVMMLRVQFERGARVADLYRQRYALSVERAQQLREGAVVMHPGPMNPGVEIDAEVADGSGLPEGRRSLVLRQVRVGVAARMAALSWCIETNGHAGGTL